MSRRDNIDTSRLLRQLLPMRKLPLLLLVAFSCFLVAACNTDTGKETKKKVEDARGLVIGDGGNFEAPTPTPRPGDEEDQATAAPIIDALPEFIKTSYPVSGTGEPGASVRVFVNDTFAAEGNIDTAGDWEVNVTDLLEGPVSITAVAVAEGKRASERSAPRISAVDGTAPAVPIIDGPVSPVTQVQPAITGRAEAESTVVLVFNGEDGAETDVASDGSWSYQIPFPLEEGEYDVAARAVDAAGNESDVSPTFSFTVNLGAGPEPEPEPEPGETTPAPSINALPDFIGSAVAITGAAPPASTVRVFAGADEVGSAVAEGDGVWEVEVSGLTEGPVSFTAEAVLDGKGPSVRSPAVTTTVDTTAPSAPEITDSGFAGEFPQVSGTGEAGSQIIVTLDGEAVGDTFVGEGGVWTFTFPFTLPAGVYTITAVASDEAGNDSAESDPYEFGIVETLPFP